ncbi:carboxypeptidase S [Hymenopellis radicata]|nr:carboxypeptidase S [Hymenopellis radicata]
MGKETLNELSLPFDQAPKPKRNKAAVLVLALAALAALSLFECHGQDFLGLGSNPSTDGATIDAQDTACVQVAPLVPVQNSELWNVTGAAISTESFKSRAVSWLGGAVQIPTETFDGMGQVGEDPRYEIHAKFRDYLLEAFPLVHKAFDREKVNTYALLYILKGSDESLKPLLLLAHMDVVPVNPDTVNEWAHPPFSGYFDGERIWGRGSSDDKSGLIGILSALELLLENNFAATRTIILAFGYDEEGGGVKGAGALYPKIVERYGLDSIAMIVDEGGGFMEQYGSTFATPGIAEKGSMNTFVQVDTPGGHSSVPPDNTCIGILSRLLVEFEEKPFDIHLERETPAYELFQCFAEHAKSLPDQLREDIKKSATSEEALRSAEDVLFQDPVYRSLSGTTTAIDVIHGGVKSNALPEQAFAVVNHRISTTSNARATKQHDTDLLLPLAQKYNLTYNAFGEDLTETNVPAKGRLTLTAPRFLDPAPVTPTVGDEATGYKLLSGTIKSTYNAHRSLAGDNIYVAPGMPTGNTDTRFYWTLTPHIFRYNHHGSGNGTNPLSGAHTVNESIAADSFLEIIRFFSTLILNVDESTTL